MLAATAFPFSKTAHNEFLLRAGLDLQPIRGAPAGLIRALLAFNDNAFEALFLR